MHNRPIIKSFFIIAILVLVSGCDRAYRYFFFPPERIEYTLVPDIDRLLALNDSSYSISKDSLSIVFNRKTYKVEVKFMSDYQLNNFEFPEESKDGEFSANPFTYANWVDPLLGFSPNRFSVLKISIFNYSASKLNFDPEKSFLVTDRGDAYSGYGREEKTSRNQSLEAYYKRRKGASGVEDDVFERRMGIVRNTVLYYGRPIYSGDSREGLSVYDPLHESVENAKVTLADFVTGYDENNEPNEFITLNFFFKRVVLEKERFQRAVIISDSGSSAPSALEPVIKRPVDIHLVRYTTLGQDEGATAQDWNAKPNALPNLIRFLKDSLRSTATLRTTPSESPDIEGASVAFIFGGASEPVLQDPEVTHLASMIKRGGFLIIDNSVFTTKFQYDVVMGAVLQNIASKLDRTAKVMPIPIDHEIFRSWRKLSGLPEGMDDVENIPGRKSELEGLYWNNRLVAVLSTKGYSMMWEDHPSVRPAQFTIGANCIVYAMKSVEKN